jgi:hypothetical protein
METRHLKLSYEESIILEKELLMIELSFLQAARRIRNYKILRRKELGFKNNLKILLKTIEIKISLLNSTFPEEGKPKMPKIKVKKIEKYHRDYLQRQLEEIREKLSKIK